MLRCFRCKISYPDTIGIKCLVCHKSLLKFHNEYTADANWTDKVNAYPQDETNPVVVYTHKENKEKFLSNVELLRNGYRNLEVGKLVLAHDRKNGDEVRVYELGHFLESLGMWWVKPIKEEINMEEITKFLEEFEDEDGKEEE